MRAAAIGALIPLNPQPLQVGDQRSFIFGARAFGVGVFDAENKRAAVMPSKEPVKKSRSRAANVQKTGR